MSVKRVDEMLAAPVIGQCYSVPTVELEFLRTTKAWPVMGLKHEDAEHLNFPYEHYHFDWRFMPDFAFRQCASHDDVQRIFGRVLHYIDRALSAPRYRLRKCRRQMPVCTIFTTAVNGVALHRAWAGRDAIHSPRGLICPHRGTALGSIAPSADGTITCPLHGLKFCATTGRSIPTCEPLPDLSTHSAKVKG